MKEVLPKEEEENYARHFANAKLKSETKCEKNTMGKRRAR